MAQLNVNADGVSFTVKGEPYEIVTLVEELELLPPTRADANEDPVDVAYDTSPFGPVATGLVDTNDDDPTVQLLREVFPGATIRAVTHLTPATGYGLSTV